MAKRMAIVLSQLQRATPAQHELEGGIVAELLMVHGLEVTVVTDLTVLGDDDTGILCLEGITGDMVMLSWIQSAEAHRHLAERGIHGRLGRTTFTRAVDSLDHTPSGNHSTRTIYHIDLRSVREVKDCCAEIERIRSEALVQVVDLGRIGAAPSRQTDATAPAAGESQTGTAARPEHTARPSTATPATVMPQNPAETTTSHEVDGVDGEDAALDRLMEQFDAWDV